MRVETVETVFPKHAVALHPLRGLAQTVRLEPGRSPLGVAPARDQPGILEHFEVLRDRWKRHVERLRELRDRGFPGGETGEDRPPRRIGDRRERRAETVGGHVCGAVPLGSVTSWFIT